MEKRKRRRTGKIYKQNKNGKSTLLKKKAKRNMGRKKKRGNTEEGKKGIKKKKISGKGIEGGKWKHIIKAADGIDPIVMRKGLQLK